MVLLYQKNIKTTPITCPIDNGGCFGSMSTVVGDEKLTSREDRIGPLFMYVQSEEDTFLKVDEVSKTKS